MAVLQAALKEKQDELQVLVDQIDKLQKEYDMYMEREKELEDDIIDCTKRLDRA